MKGTKAAASRAQECPTRVIAAWLHGVWEVTLVARTPGEQGHTRAIDGLLRDRTPRSANPPLRNARCTPFVRMISGTRAAIICHDELAARMDRRAIGRKVWAIPEGYIPPTSHGPAPELTSHEAACLLNAGDRDAHIEITIFFEKDEPAGPYRVTVPARHTRHVRFNELDDPQPIPRGTAYSSVICSDEPVVVQHTRLDSRQADNALLSTIAFAAGD